MKSDNLIDIKSMDAAELKTELKTIGEPSYRADQIYKWLQSGINSFDEMSNLPKGLRDILKSKYYIAYADIKKKLVSSTDGTEKYLMCFNDGECVEAVLMKYHHGYSMCISTQVGCKMNCSFCATGKSGFIRNLTASEMLAQIEAAQRENKSKKLRVSNIVLMGMGEPLDNYNNVLRFLKLVSSDDGLNIGMRHISLSTCGLVDKIYDLAKERLQLTLSVSLHAPNDLIRNQIMPINKKFKVDQLLDACRFYSEQTKRRISFEYAMIDNINDSDECAKELAEKLAGMLCHVNLIPVNTVANSIYKKSGMARIKSFINILERKKLNVTVRRTLGSDINASCGQLKSDFL